MSPKSLFRNSLNGIELLESRIAPAGLVTVDYNPTTGELTLTGDAQPNAFDVFQAQPGTYRVEGKTDDVSLTKTSIGELGNGAFTIHNLTRLTIASGEGSDEIDLANLALASLAVDTAGGDDDVEADNISTMGDSIFVMGSGADEVNLDGLTTLVGGNLTIRETDGGVKFEFAAAQTKVLGELLFVGGSGSDELTTSADTNLKLRKGLNFNGGTGGANKIEFGEQGAIVIGRNVNGESIVFAGAAGVDTISIGGNRVKIKGSIGMDGGAGADVLDLDGVTVAVGQSLAGVSILMTGGAGEDELDVQGSNVSIAGSLEMNGGTEADSLDLTNAHRLTIGGAIRFDAGMGADALAIEADVLQLASGVKFLGGDGADTVSIEADGTINGSVELLLGGTPDGVQEVTVRGLSGLVGALIIGGALTIESTGAAASMDLLKLTNVVVSNAVALRAGDGPSSVDLDNLMALDLLTIDTGAGADEVAIERDGDDGFSVFRNTVTIALGAGDDLLLIGKGTSNNRGKFLAPFNADGGTGTDTRNDIAAANQFTTSASFTSLSFENTDAQ